MAEDAARRLRVVEETEVGLVEGINFPAQKEEGASDTESNNASRDLVDQIRNVATEQFNGPQEVMQTIRN